MRISPDQLIFWQHGLFKLNETIATSWALMFVLVAGAMLVTRKLEQGKITVSGWQSLLEIIVTSINSQIEETGLAHPEKYIGFLGTLFLFIALSGICTLLPGYDPPTSSLSTTAALALCVFIAVPFFGIRAQGLGGYLCLLHAADFYHAAIQYHQRVFADAGDGYPPVRQHDERGNDCRHPAQHHAVSIPRSHDGARAAYQHGAGIYFQHSRRRLHRRGYRARSGFKSNNN